MKKQREREVDDEGKVNQSDWPRRYWIRRELRGCQTLPIYEGGKKKTTRNGSEEADNDVQVGFRLGEQETEP